MDRDDEAQDPLAGAARLDREPEPEPVASTAPMNGQPCMECQELHGELVDAGRALVIVGVSLTAAILALGLILYVRGRGG